MTYFGAVGALVGVACLATLAWPRRKRVVSDSGNTEPFSLPYWPVCVFATIPPVLGLSLCLFIAGVWHHSDTCKTHCGVYNFWPSISSAIGNNAPETYIWRFSVGLHNVITFGDSLLMYHNLLAHVPDASAVYVALARVCTVAKMTSCLSLFLLTFVSSSEDFALHETGFVMWLISGATCILLFVCLWLYGRPKRGAEDKFAWRWTVGWASLYFACLPLAALLYWWHNAFCHAYVYSFFGITEWVTVIAYVFGCGWSHHVVFKTHQLRLAICRLDSGKQE